MDIAISKTKTEFPLSQRKPLKKTIPVIALFLIIFIGVAISLSLIAINLDLFSRDLILPILVILFVLFSCISIFSYIYQVWYFKLYYYELSDDFIIIKKRVFTPREITIPYERVQDVYVDQDILDRIFGIYDVHLSSATISSGMEAHIDGLEKAAALGLRDKLLVRVSEKIKKPKN